MAKRRTYTVFVQQDNGYGTIWIDKVTCRTKDGKDDIAHIKYEAERKCAIEWGLEDGQGNPDPSGLVCMGIATGNPRFLYFDDSHMGDG